MKCFPLHLHILEVVASLWTIRPTDIVSLGIHSSSTPVAWHHSCIAWSCEIPPVSQTPSPPACFTEVTGSVRQNKAWTAWDYTVFGEKRSEQPEITQYLGRKGVNSWRLHSIWGEKEWTAWDYTVFGEKKEWTAWDYTVFGEKRSEQLEITQYLGRKRCEQLEITQ